MPIDFNMLRLQQACQSGSQCACDELKSMTIMGAGFALEMADDLDATSHPNKLPFNGVLLQTDMPSNKPPHGSHGHRILVPKHAAEKNLKGLIGMGINVDPGDLNEHMPQHKIGVITDAGLKGNNVWVKGFIYRKDFPEAERQLRNRKDLGMSMELANVDVRDENDPVWYLQDFDFTGATILKKNAAAYQGTSLAARAAKQTTHQPGRPEVGKGELSMKTAVQGKHKKAVAAAGDNNELANVIASAVRAGNKDLVKEVRASNAGIGELATRIDELGGIVIQGAAGSNEFDSSDASDASGTVVRAARKKKAADASDMSDASDASDASAMDAAGRKKAADASDASDATDASDMSDSSDASDASEDDLSAELEKLAGKPPHAEPGEVNHGMKTKGRKTTVTDVGASRERQGTASLMAAAQTVRTIKAAAKKVKELYDVRAAKQERKIAKLHGRLERMEAQLQAAAENTDRRSVIPVDLTNLAAKSNIDLHEIQASGAKLTVEQVDGIIAASGLPVDHTQKVAWKNRLLQLDLMDAGEVNRTYTN